MKRIFGIFLFFIFLRYGSCMVISSGNVSILPINGVYKMEYILKNNDNYSTHLDKLNYVIAKKTDEKFIFLDFSPKKSKEMKIFNARAFIDDKIVKSEIVEGKKSILRIDVNRTLAPNESIKISIFLHTMPVVSKGVLFNDIYVDAGLPPFRMQDITFRVLFPKNTTITYVLPAPEQVIRGEYYTFMWNREFINPGELLTFHFETSKLPFPLLPFEGKYIFWTTALVFLLAIVLRMKLSIRVHIKYPEYVKRGVPSTIYIVLRSRKKVKCKVNVKIERESEIFYDSYSVTEIKKVETLTFSLPPLKAGNYSIHITVVNVDTKEIYRDVEKRYLVV